MNLLVSKALIICLFVHWLKISFGKSHLKAGYGAGASNLEEGSGDILVDSIKDVLIDGSINNSCVENMKHEFEDNLKKYVDLLSTDIHSDIKLYKDHDHIHLDFGSHKYIKYEENSTEVEFVEHNHSKYVSVEWNEIEAKVETSSSGSTTLFIKTSNSTLNCTYLVDTSKHHGNIILHPVFFTLAFSPDGQKLMYLAEAPPNPALDWIRFSPHLGGNWKYKVKKPLLFVLDIQSREIKKQAVPDGHVAGKSLWKPDSASIITVVRPMRFTPCPECTDHPTRLVQIDVVTGSFDYLSEAEDHVSFPAFTPDGEHMLFFKNKLWINHHEKVVLLYQNI